MSKYLQHKYNNLLLLVLTMLALLISGLISVNAQSVLNGDFEDLGEVIKYPVQACYSQSTNYTLKVNGVAVPLLKHEYYPYTGAASKEFNVMFANFEFEGTAVIEIARGSGDITSVNISPKRLNIEYETPNTKSIKFAITEPRHLYLTINGAEILLFAEAKRTNKPNTSGTGIYNITDYGAASNSSTSVIQTTAIQNAINAASNAGGGIVYVPAGLYYIQALTLKQNVHIYLEGGAVLRGTGNKNDYTGYIVAGNKVLMFNGTSTTHKSNIKIYGPGIIDANGVSTADVDNLTDLFNKINLRGGPSIRIIDIRYASNITIEDVTCIEGTNWQVSFEEVDNLEVCRVKVIGHRTMKWNDGIDVGACQRVGIRNCFALGMDDNFCIKDEPNAPSEDITIENCMGYSHSRTFKIGFQSGNAVRRCNIKNIDVIRSRQACHFMQTNGTGAIWEDIHIDNFNIDNNLQASDPNDTFSASPFEIQLSLSGGVAKNVIVNNFTYSGDNWASSEYDSDLNENTTNTTIDNISFTNFKVGGNYATTSGEAKMGINGATNVTFAVNPSMVPPVIKNASIPGMYISGLPTFWVLDGAGSADSTIERGRCVSLDGSVSTSTWHQKLTGLNSGSQYRLSGYIKTESVSGGNAYFRVGTSTNSGTKTGTAGWSQVTVDFTASGITEDIYCVLTGTSGKAFFDDISLELLSSGVGTVYQAEDPAFASVVSGTTTSGATGQFVDLEAGGSITWVIPIAGNVSGNLTFAIASPANNLRSMGVYVNGSKVGVVSTSSSTYSEVTIPNVAFVNGNNTIELRDSEGTQELNVDYLLCSLNITTQVFEADAIAKPTVTVMPNPVTNGRAKLLVEGFDDEIKIQLITMNGAIVLQTISHSSLTELVLSGINAGVYVLQVTDKNTTISKLIVLK